MAVKTVFLIGAIAAGKSTVLSHLESLGADVLSADSVVHNLYETDVELIRQIEESFGPVLTESQHVNRQRLAAHLVQHPEDVMTLEGIVHPRVRDFLVNARKKAKAKVFVYELPISRPTTDFTLADAIILVTAPEEIRVKRIMQRGLTHEEALQRISLHPEPFIPQQIPMYLIGNDGDETKLLAQTTAVWNEILGD